MSDPNISEDRSFKPFVNSEVYADTDSKDKPDVRRSNIDGPSRIYLNV